MQIELSAHDAAVLVSRLAAAKLSPVAKAAEKHEAEFKRVFLRSIREAQDAINMRELEDALSVPGTGAALYVLQPVFDMLIEETKLTTQHETYIKAAAAKPQVKLKDVLSATLQSGAAATDMCVLDENVGIHIKTSHATVDQVNQAWKMKLDGVSNIEIANTTGIPYNQVNHVISKVKKYKASILNITAPPKVVPLVSTPITPTPVVPPYVAPPAVIAPTVPPVEAVTLSPSKIAKWDSGHPSKKPFEQFWYEKKQYHAFTDAEIQANFQLHGLWAPTDYDDLQTTVANVLAKGKIQADKFEAAKVGAKYTPPAQPVYKSPIPSGPYARGQNWPVADDVVRSMGKNYPIEVENKFEPWKQTLTSKQRRAIEDYTGSSYSGMNSILRGNTQGYSNPEYYTERIKDVTNAIKKAPKPPPPELVWRGTHSSDWAGNLSTGDVIEMQGFQSTSIKPEFASSWGSSTGTLLEIKPSQGAYVKALSSHKHEYEYLLPHGAKYRVVGRKPIKMYDSNRGSVISREVIQLEML